MSTLPTDAEARKAIPLSTGLFEYFADALCAVAHHSYKGSKQHHPDKPVHWDKGKSNDHADCLLRHQIEGDYVSVAWRALAQLQIAIEEEGSSVEALHNEPLEERVYVYDKPTLDSLKQAAQDIDAESEYARLKQERGWSDPIISAHLEEEEERGIAT